MSQLSAFAFALAGAVVLALPMGSGLAAAADERAAIASERAALTARYAAEEKACRDRFAVTACVDDVRQRRRNALQPLRERELQIDDTQRKQRAAQRKSAIAAKSEAAALRPPAPAGHEGRVRAAPAARSASAARAGRLDDDGVGRAAKAAERVQAARQRQEEMQAAQARVAKRQADIEAKAQATGKVSQPLPVPVPAAASAPGR